MRASSHLDTGYPVRTAEICGLAIIDVSLSSIIQLGDRGYYTPKLRALAVQREEGHETAGSVYFESYEIFERPLPVLNDPAFENDEAVIIHRTNCSPRINVGCIFITAVGSASTVQAGNTMETVAESRIKHIRQYRRKPRSPGRS
ncbi:spore germination protein GerPE [Paenibacillus gorillae]|uniref:spore germination protein GerPE n=1 Tax=Paenibacillus gorillae TaxID=1243662 RepID=UPI0004AF1D99|nr:spore germination protein GerPE [Paenibacillus gorillae]